jgi:Icc-related predicted phosphoesterase
VRVLQVSDLHSSVRAAERAGEKARNTDSQVVIVAGDITNFGTLSEAEKLLRLIKERSGTPVLFVAGNCDPPELLIHAPTDDEIVNNHSKSFHLGGYNFLGIGGSRETPHRGTWIEMSETEFGQIVSSLSQQASEKWVLITHNPPSGVEAARSASGLDLGSPSIRAWIARAKPLVVCCGHVHEARSISYIDGIPVVNAGPARDGNCAVIELMGNKALPRLERL